MRYLGGGCGRRQNDAVAGQLVQGIEHEADVVQVDPHAQVRNIDLLAELEDRRAEHVHVGDQDHVHLGRRRLDRRRRRRLPARLVVGHPRLDAGLGPRLAANVGRQHVLDAGGNLPLRHAGSPWARSLKAIVPVFFPVWIRGTKVKSEAFSFWIAPGKGKSTCCKPARDRIVGLNGSSVASPRRRTRILREQCDLRIGVVVLPDDLPSVKSTPSRFHSWLMSPLGSALRLHEGIHAAGRLPGHALRGRHWRQIGQGSSKIAVGWPLRTAATKLSISSRPQRRRLHGQQHVVIAR